MQFLIACQNIKENLGIWQRQNCNCQLCKGLNLEAIVISILSTELNSASDLLSGLFLVSLTTLFVFQRSRNFGAEKNQIK